MARRTAVIVIAAALALAVSTAHTVLAYEGELAIFLANQEIGREEFGISAEGIVTQGTLAVGGQTVALETRLTADTYEWKQMGVAFSGKFEPGAFKAVVGPVKLSYALPEPYLVLDNNVFSHYQQVIGLVNAGVQEVSVLVPVLVLAGSEPVLEGKLWYEGRSQYVADGEALELEEYGALVGGSVYVRVLADQGRLVMVEVPGQGARAVLRGYEGLKVLADASEAAEERSEEFRVENGSVALAGTLTFPEGSGPFPVVLLTSGTGPQDRDGNTPPALMTDMFKIMAQEFTRIGVAVLRYDERGVGESTGTYDSATFTDLVSDIQALIAYLKQHPLIDPQRIVILGHSEGGYFAPLIAAEDPTIAGIILLGAPSAPLDEIMIEQLEYQAGLEFLSTQERAAIASYLEQVQQLLADAQAGKEESVLPVNLEWLREHMAHDPLAVIRRVKQPVLIIHGEDDLKVQPYHAERLRQELLDAGNHQVELHILPRTTHEFMLFPLDNPDYDPTNPWQVVPELYEVIGRWLKTVLID